MKTNTAMVALILTLAGIAEAACPPKATPEILAKGKEVYAKNCVLCHGETGKGDGIASGSLNPKPRNFTVGDFKNGGEIEQLFKTITNGLGGVMPAWSATIPEDADRCAVAHYVHSMKK